MARPLLTEESWQLVAPLLPRRLAHTRGGRPPVPDRAVLTGILFVLKTGIAWEDLPEEMGCGCGLTCLRRLREWQQTGVWDQIREQLANRLHYADRINWWRAEAVSLERSMISRHRGRGHAPLELESAGLSHPATSPLRPGKAR